MNGNSPPNKNVPSKKTKSNILSQSKFLYKFISESSNNLLSPPIQPNYLRSLSPIKPLNLNKFSQNTTRQSKLPSYTQILKQQSENKTKENISNFKKVLNDNYASPDEKQENYHKLLQSSLLTSKKSRTDYYSLYLSRIDWGIPKKPYRVLEAPGLSNNFYTNILTWNKFGVFLAIDQSLHSYIPITKKSSRYLKLPSIGWVRDLIADDITNSNSTKFEGSSNKNIYKLSNSESITCVSSCKFDETKLALSTSNGAVILLDLIKNKPYLGYKAHNGRIGCITWGSDSLLGTGSADKKINLFDHRIKPSKDAANFFEVNLSSVNYHKGEITGLKFSPDGRMIASGSNDNEFCIWDQSMIVQSRGLSPLLSYKNMNSAVRAMEWSPKNRGVICIGGGMYDKKLRVIDVLSGKEPLFEIDTGSQICSLAWSGWRNQIVSAHGFCENEINIWDYPTMRKVGTMNGHKCRVLHLALSADEKQFITGSSDETIKFWNLDKDPEEDEIIAKSWYSELV